MFKLTLTVLFVLVIGLPTQAQTVSVLRDTGDEEFVYEQLSDALAEVEDGDVLHLSGGEHNPTNVNLTIDHQIEIVGAGLSLPDSSASGSTRINGTIHLLTSAGGLVLKGVHFLQEVRVGTNSTNDDISGLYSELCWFEGGLNLSYSSSGTYPSNMLFLHCITGTVAIDNALGVDFRNCIVGIYGMLTMDLRQIIVSS